LLIVFDLDDTLIDTSGTITPYKFRCILDFLKLEGVCLPDDAVQQVFDLNHRCKTSKETIRLLLERWSASHLFSQAMALYTAPLPNHFAIPTTPGTQKVLPHLKKKLHILTLVTGGVNSFQREKLEKAGLEPSLFSKIAVPEDSKKGPHYEALLREFSIPPRDGWVVGDRVWMDLAPARDLGLHTIHMRWGRGLREHPEKWVDASISSLEELLGII
jgi:putative hydrolase of the HAD superfamily